MRFTGLCLVTLAATVTASANPVKQSSQKPPAQPSSPSLDQVNYLTKPQLFQLFPGIATGEYGWPGDGKHPPMPIYPVAKNRAQLRWQVDEYNRLLHMAQEDVRMSQQVDDDFSKNSGFYNDAAARGDLKSMKSLGRQSRDITQQMMKYGYDQEVHMFKALGLHRALVLNPDFTQNYQEGDRSVDYMHSPNLVQKTNANELRFALANSAYGQATPGSIQQTDPEGVAAPNDQSLPGYADGRVPNPPMNDVPTDGSSSSVSAQPHPPRSIPPVTAKTYRYIPPPGGVPASLMRFEKILDRYVKLHPYVITAVTMAHGHVEWVRVVDAQRSSSVAYPYTVNAEVRVSYPADLDRGEKVPYKSLERPSFQVNPATREVGSVGQF